MVASAEEIVSGSDGPRRSDERVLETTYHLHVKRGDPLFVMENEKVEVEIEAEDGGILQRTEADGFVAPVGSVVGWLHTTQAEYDAAQGAS